MFYSLKGKIKYKGENFLAIESGDIGWQIFVPHFLLDQVKTGQALEVYTYLYSREDTIELYGFTKLEELDFFKQLIAISGIGPKSAMGVLSEAKLKDLKRAISREDPSVLTKVSGIGQRTAERIIVELKSKIQPVPGQKVGEERDEDVVDALIGLGYKIAEARRALRQVPEDVKGTQERLKASLKVLSR